MTDQRQDEMPLRKKILTLKAEIKEAANYMIKQARFSDNMRAGIEHAHNEIIDRSDILARYALENNPATITPDQVETVRKALEMFCQSYDVHLAHGTAFKDLVSEKQAIEANKALALLPQGDN